MMLHIMCALARLSVCGAFGRQQGVEEPLLDVHHVEDVYAAHFERLLTPMRRANMSLSLENWHKALRLHDRSKPQALVVISCGIVYVATVESPDQPFEKVHDFMWTSLVEMAQAVEEHDVPDMAFIACASDWPCGFDRDGKALVWPTFAVNWAPWKWHIPIPYAIMWQTNDLLKKPWHTDYPWSSKIEKGVFRGSVMCPMGGDNRCWQCSRLRAFAASKQHPHLLDVEFTQTWNSSEVCLAGYKTPSVMPFEHFAAYKYLVHLDGQGAANRLCKLLSLNSVVFKQESDLKEYYYDWLIPGKHFVPFACAGYSAPPWYRKLDWTQNLRCDLDDAILQAKRNDEKMHDIVDNANEFARKYFTVTARQLYWLYALRAYHSLGTAMGNVFHTSPGYKCGATYVDYHFGEEHVKFGAILRSSRAQQKSSYGLT